tara:strand:- start:605 stop:1051 length:447 start_codon:yes stop_codon:yes gene_type:complete
MDTIITREFDININPSDLNNLNICKLLKSRFEGKVIDELYIIKIISSELLSFCSQIQYDGFIQCKVSCTATVINPIVGQIYTLTVNNTNKMGAVCKVDTVTVFIPKHYCIHEILPDINERIDVQIVGKRIEGNITCIGKIIISEPDQT